MKYLEKEICVPGAQKRKLRTAGGDGLKVKRWLGVEYVIIGNNGKSG